MIASDVLAPEPTSEPMVFVVDDDESVRDSLELLIREVGWRPKIFSSAHEFLAYAHADSPRCLVLDMSLPDLSGLELQKSIAFDQRFMPIIFITGVNDVPKTVAAMKAGAFEFLIKPFGPEVLLHAIGQALHRSQRALARRAATRVLNDAYTSLTSRERDVMSLVVSGLLNKQIASELGISIITVKAHRGRVMQKMAANSVADLVKMDARLRMRQ